MKSKVFFCTPFFLALPFLTLVPCRAKAVIVTNVLIDSVSTQLTNGFARGAEHLVDGSGLFGNAHTELADGAMWLNNGIFTTPNDPASSAELTFDLGAVRTLEQMRVWNYNEANQTARGIATADILVAGADRVFTNAIAGQAFTRAPGTLTNFMQIINLGGVRARFVKFDVLTNHGDGNLFAGLSEVQFIDTNLPPVLVSADRKFSNRQITVKFSEAVLPATATNRVNYQVSGGVTVSNVVAGPTANVVVLNTSALQSNGVYTVTVNGVRDAMNAQAVPANSQVSVGSELALWLKSDAGVMADASGFVTNWVDQSGNANNATQPTAGLQPLLVTNVFNGKPALRFDGTDDSLSSTSAPSLLLTGDMTLFAVVQLANYVNYNGIVAKTLDNLPAPFDLYTLPGTGLPRFFRGSGGGANSFITGTKSPSTNAPHLVAVSVRVAQGSEYLDGAFNGGGTLSAATADRDTPLMVGTRQDLVTQLSGDLAEVMVFRAALSDTDRVALDSYFGSKYGIPVVSLIITEQPASTNILEGETATFRVAVTANSPDISYQWQRNGTNIAGATNSLYTTPSVTLADSNSLYRVVVSIPGTSQTSQSAVLTVSPDRTAPIAVSAGKGIANSSEVTVVFSEPVSAATATNKNNYVFDNNVTVSGARVGSNPNTVVLTTSPLPNGINPQITINNVQDRFGNTIAANSQLTVGFYPAGLALWLKADPADAPAGPAGEVSVWSDRSGNVNNATQTDPAAMPTLVTNSINGKAVVRFDGVDDHLIIASSPTVAIVGDMTVYAVANFVDYGNYNGIIGKTAANLPASYDFYLVQGSGTPRFYRGDGGGANGQVSGTESPAVGAPHIISVVMGDTTVSHYLDAQPNGTGTLDTVLADVGTSLFIGSREDLVTQMKGDFAEIMIFSTALTDADRQSIDSYLGAKYGLATAGPIRLSITRSGTQVTISWPITPGTDVLEGTASLPATSWNSAGPITQSNGMNSVTVTTSGTAQFFRVRKT